MVKLYEQGVFYKDGKPIPESEANGLDKKEFSRKTIAYGILKAHDSAQSEGEDALRLKFDALASHDITYVGIIQTARASGLKAFPIPYALTNCHNSLCAVGGTINEDDHVFGLSAAQKYGGIYVPAHFAVIHQYMRETLAGGGKMLLGSDSHTRYGAFGTLAIGEGGGELVKQILGKTYDIPMPKVVGVRLLGAPKAGVGPMDIALSIIKAVFDNGFVKNKIMEFIGEGISRLSMDYRNGIDVMTTETACLSSVWVTDDTTRAYLEAHNRLSDFKLIEEPKAAYYDSFIDVDLSKAEPMIAMPFHPSNAFAIREVNENLDDILNLVEKNAAAALENPELKLNLKDKIRNGKFYVDQAVIAGCAGGTYENICAAAALLNGKNIGKNELALSVYPASQPVFKRLTDIGCISQLMQAGATIRSAFCGPCFGAGDVPRCGAFSVRHTTRNFPHREGSKPGAGQLASVALMDALSITATCINGGALTAADVTPLNLTEYVYDETIYQNRVYNGFNKPEPSVQLKCGPNIVDWPEMPGLADNLLLNVCAFISDAVTTTDELIPSGETSSYRSNPLGLAEFTLSRKDPEYVPRAKEVHNLEKKRRNGELSPALNSIFKTLGADYADTAIGSVIYANRPGDGSAREQAASCQKVLGGLANIAREYATKRYRSNLVNWGMLPFIIQGEPTFATGDYIYIPQIKNALITGQDTIKATVIKGVDKHEITLHLPGLTRGEADIIIAGCLINYYAS